MNLYWPVYRKIEEEVISLADTIHFSEDQLDVYSVSIADLIIRCAIEIESISKDLYCKLGGDMNPKDNNGKQRDLYFDTDCIKLINDTRHLEKKAIILSANNMHFQKMELYPLKKANKRGSSGSKWKKAYQDLKHDRYRTLKKGNIENLLNALGALYILNIYYADDSYDAGLLGLSPMKLESIYSSKVFKAHYSYATEIQWDEEVSDKNIIWNEENHDLEKSLYIVKVSDDDYKRQHSEWSYVQRKRYNLFSSNKRIQQYIKTHPDCTELSMEEICLLAGGLRLANEIMGIRELDWVERPLIQVIVNKNNDIYPYIKKIDVHHIDEVLADEYFYKPEKDWWNVYR